MKLTAAELLSRYAKGERDFRDAYLLGADLRYAILDGAILDGALLQGANLQGASLRFAYLRFAYLGHANLRDVDLQGARLSWSSHNLLSEILWRAADTESRQMLAAFVGRKTDWCWDEWETWQHPEREWALAELAKWVRDGDDAPEIVLRAKGES